MNGVLVFLGNIVGSVVAGFAVRVLYDKHKEAQAEIAAIGFENLSDPVVKGYLEVTK
jgi:hypothetical protein